MTAEQPETFTVALVLDQNFEGDRFADECAASLIGGEVSLLRSADYGEPAIAKAAIQQAAVIDGGRVMLVDLILTLWRPDGRLRGWLDACPKDEGGRYLVAWGMTVESAVNIGEGQREYHAVTLREIHPLPPSPAEPRSMYTHHVDPNATVTACGETVTAATMRPLGGKPSCPTCIMRTVIRHYEPAGGDGRLCPTKGGHSTNVPEMVTCKRCLHFMSLPPVVEPESVDLLEDHDGSPYPEQVQAAYRAVVQALDPDHAAEVMTAAAEVMRQWGIADGIDGVMDALDVKPWTPQWGRPDWKAWLREQHEAARYNAENYGEPEDLGSPYDEKTFAEVLDDYLDVRGDLSEQYAREQLVSIVEKRIERARAEGADAARGITRDTRPCAVHGSACNRTYDPCRPAS